ncbi:unnamed protein product [Amoebophrya sp. A25]|nr:unnamed protein product [Amoebophrya sp. A25]|eukprot:GSA25T00002417001.1
MVEAGMQMVGDIVAKSFSPTTLTRPLHIVEFCAGSGHVAFPLLWKQLHLQEGQHQGSTSRSSRPLEFTILDMNREALHTAERRVLDMLGEMEKQFGLVRTLDEDGEDGHGQEKKAPPATKRQHRSRAQIVRTFRFFRSTPSTSTTAPRPRRGSEQDSAFPSLTIRLVQCMVSEYSEVVDVPFDLGIALHACGRASDEVMTLCAEKSAGFVVAPCCVGRLAQNVGATNIIKDPHHSATTTATTTSRFLDRKWDSVLDVCYPRSALFREHLRVSYNDFCVLAKAADFASHSSEDNMLVELEAEVGATTTNTTITSTNTIGGKLGGNAPNQQENVERAKICVQRDRLQFLEESFGTRTELRKMVPLNCTPKNDILLGWT